MRRAFNLLLFLAISAPSIAWSHEFDATFDTSTNLLTIPPFDVSSMGRFTATLQLTDADNLLFRLAEANATTSQSPSSGSYSSASQILSLNGLRAIGVRFSAEFLLTSAEPAIFKLTNLATLPEQVQQCEANEPGNGDQIIAGPDGPQGEDRDSVFRSLTVSRTNADVIFMGTERNGFLRSLDGGQSWQQLRQGLRHFEALENYPEIWDMVVHPLNNEVIYAATLDSPGPVTGDFPSTPAGVYKSIDGGNSWFRASCGLENSRATSVAIDPLQPNRILLGIESGTPSFSQLQGVTFDGGIYVSTDDGSQWNKLFIHNDDVSNGFTQIVPYGSDGEFISFGMNRDNTDTNVGFVRITNHGEAAELFAGSLRNLLIPWFAVSEDGQVIYAIEQDAFVIRKTTDGGMNWISIQRPVNGPIAVSPEDSEVIIFSQSTSMWKSIDGGSNAELVLEAAGPIHDILFAPSDPNTVYVASEGYLFYKSTDGGDSFVLMGNLRESVLNAN